MRKLIVVLVLAASCAGTGKREPVGAVKGGVTFGNSLAGCDARGPSAFDRKGFLRDLTRYPKALRNIKVSVEFVDLDIREALMEVSQSATIPIVVGEGVSGVVSLKASERPLFDVMDMIVRAGSFDYKYMNEYIFVGMVDPGLSTWSKLAYPYAYKAKGLRPTEIKKLVNGVYQSYIEADDGLRILNIHAPKDVLVDIVESLWAIDRTPQQVALHMSIAEISATAQLATGRNNLKGTANDVLQTLAPIQIPSEPTVISSIAYRTFLDTISALAVAGDAEVKAQPKVVVLEGQEAKVRASEQHLLSMQNDAATGKPIFLGADVGFTIIPRVEANGDILLEIREAKSSDLGNISAQSAALSEQSMSTTVRIGAGQSLLLGGMIKNKTKIIATKVPLLGDIPLIGWFFKGKRKEDAKMEVVFSVRPELVCRRS